jgi:hypothetical protein
MDLGNPERIPVAYATAYYRFMQNFAKVRVSEIRRLRYMGLAHVACLSIMFIQGRLAMTCMSRENVSLAALFFRA